MIKIFLFFIVFLMGFSATISHSSLDTPVQIIDEQIISATVNFEEDYPILGLEIEMYVAHTGMLDLLFHFERDGVNYTLWLNKFWEGPIGNSASDPFKIGTNGTLRPT